jgi:hypothetical protein
MNGEEPISEHVWRIVAEKRLLGRRWRWRCTCGATEAGYVTKTAALFDADNHSMR